MDFVKKQDYIWNTMAGMLNAAEAVIMSMLVTRVTGLTDAGVLTIAFAIGNLMMTIGKFGVRNFQVTDSKQQYSFTVYLKTRLLTVFIMIIATGCYLLYASIHLGDGKEKLLAILSICLIYAVESVEDVFWGFYQQRNFLAIGAKLFCARWISILVFFSFALLYTHNIGISLFVSFLVSIIAFIIMLLRTYPSIGGQPDKINSLLVREEDRKEMRNLIMEVFPLFGSNFLSFYVNNSSKYAIDSCMSDSVQACYGFVAMPVFVIGLLNMFIYQPTLVHMANEWKEGKNHQIIERIQKQIIFIICIMIICILGAYVLGIPILSILYHTDLSNYKTELLILLVAGGFLAVSGYLGVVLTIMRCQRAMLVSYGIVSVVAFIGLKKVVVLYGTIGAAFSYVVLIFILCMLYSGVLYYRIKKCSD